MTIEDRLVVGGTVLLSDVELGLSNIEARIVEIRRNHLKPGETSVVLSTRARRLTDLILKGQDKQTKALQKSIKILQTPPAVPVGPGPSTIPTITLSASISSDVPTVTASVSPGVVAVRFAVNASAFPDFATTLLSSPDTSSPFTYEGAAMTPGDFLYVSAIATDNNGVNSVIATVLVEDPASFVDPGGGQVMTIDFYDPFTGGAATDEARWDYVNTAAAANVYNASGGIEGTGCGEEHDPGGPNWPAYWQYSAPAPGGNIAHHTDFYVVARFNLAGKTVAAETPLIQAYFTGFVLTMTPTRTVKLYVDDGFGGLTLLGESVNADVIPSTGFCRIDLRAQSSNSATGFCWVRVSTDPAVAGDLVEFAPNGGGDNVHYFTGLTFWEVSGGSTSGSLINSIGFGTGTSNGDWDFGSWPGTMIDGVQWDNIAVVDPTGFGDYDWASNA